MTDCMNEPQSVFACGLVSDCRVSTELRAKLQRVGCS
jgi:hypothetical protein